MKTNILLTISIVILFISCTEEIKLKEEYIKRQLVINSFITTGESVIVNLFQNIPINSKHNQSLKTIAKVVLYENDIEMETLEPIAKYYYESQIGKMDSTYVYISKKTEIITGNTYKIVITCDGFETVTAETTIPAPVLITAFDSLTVQKNDYFGNKIREHNFKLGFTDPAKQSNYYRLVVTERYFPKSRSIIGSDTIWYIDISNRSYRDYSVDISSSDPLMTNENKDANSYIFGELDNSYGIFSDEMIDGKHYELNFTAYFDNFYGKNIEYEAGEFRSVKIILQSINADMHDYLKSIDTQEYSDYQMFTEPVPIYSNVENGFGIFGAYVNSEIEIIYGEYPKEGVRYLTWEEIQKLSEK